MRRRLSLLANNGDIGGGEVMLLQMAQAAQSGGYDVLVVAPRAPGALADQARTMGFDVHLIDGEGRLAYMRSLRRWAAGRTEMLWCNGLVPALATALLRGTRRIVHLHRIPDRQQRPAVQLATLGAVRVVAPSRFVAEQLPRCEVMPNWTRQIDPVTTRTPDGSRVLGYLGRIAEEKGVLVLLESLQHLPEEERQRTSLLLAGEPRFVSPSEAETLRTAIAAAGPTVQLRGWLEPGQLFSQIDVLVVPSIAQESFGLSAAEAMAADLPVIVSDAGALPEVVGEDHHLVSKAGDAADLAKVIHSSSAQSEFATPTGRARRRWLDLYSPEAGTRRFLQILDTLTGASEDESPFTS